MSTKIVVLHGNNYWNMGDLGLMIAFLDSLKREFNQPEIVILSAYTNRPRPTGQTLDLSQMGVIEKPGLTFFSLRSKHSLYERVVFIAHAAMVLVYLLVRRALDIQLTVLLPTHLTDPINTLYEADLIISKPGGFLYDLKESPIPAPHQLLFIVAAVLIGRPVVIYAQSIGPFKRPYLHGIVRFVLDRCQLITVRDELSLQECQKVLRLERARIEFTADEAFLLTSIDGKEGRERLGSIGVPSRIPLVGMTVVNWAFPGVSNPRLSKARYLQTITKLIDHINDRYGAHVIIFLFALTGAYPLDDEAISQEVHSKVKYPNMVHICRETDPRIIKGIQKEMEIFVGSRTHSNIFALGSCVPAIAISYLPKTEGIMAMLGLSDYVLDINTLELADLKSLFDLLWCDRIKIRAHLKQVIPEIQAKARQNARLAKSVLENALLNSEKLYERFAFIYSWLS